MRFLVLRTQTREIKLTGEKITSGAANLSVSYKLIETATMEIVSMNDVAHHRAMGRFLLCRKRRVKNW